MAQKRFITVKLEQSVVDRLNAIKAATGMTLSEVVAALLDAHEGKVMEKAIVEGAGGGTIDADIKQAVADIMFVLEPVVDALTSIIYVYPDLRAEAGLAVATAQQRFAEVAQAWGLWQTGGESEAETEEREGEQLEGE